MRSIIDPWMLAGLAAMALGCAPEGTAPSKTTSSVAGDWSHLMLDSEPEGVSGLHDVYDQLAAKGSEDPQDLEERVLVLGRVGPLDASDDPEDLKAKWVRDSAEFKLADPESDAESGTSADAGSTEGATATEDAAAHAHHHDDPDHECPFCSAKGPGMQVVVRFLTEDGEAIPVDARTLFQFQGDDLVVIRGKAHLEPGNLVIHGDGIYVRH